MTLSDLFSGIGRIGVRHPKRVSPKEIVVLDKKLKIGEDIFDLSNIYYATINVDPNPNNGLAGAIEIKAKKIGGIEGVELKSHQYVVLGKDNKQSVRNLIDKLSGHQIQVDGVSVDHNLFSESFLGTPQIKPQALN